MKLSSVSEHTRLLHRACTEADLIRVKDVVERLKCDPNAKDEDGNTALNVAASTGNLDLVKYLVEKCGCEPSHMDTNQNTALNIAARSGSFNVLKYIIEDRECSSRCTGQLKRSLLHNACEGKSNMAVVKYLVETCSLDPTTRDMNNDTSLNIAASSSSLDILQYFVVTRKCGIRYTGHLGRTLLHNACEENGSLAAVKFLVEEHGCDVLSKDDDGNTPLHIASLFGHLDVVVYLIENRKCNPECPGKYGRTPLLYACEKSLAIVKYLVETKGCNPCTSKDNNGDLAVHRAAQSRDLDVLKYLIEEKKCDTTITGVWKRNLLHNACIVGHLATVKYLVEELGFDVHCCDVHDFNPLDCATSSNHATIINYLKEKMRITDLQPFPLLLPPGSVTTRNDKTRIWSPQNLSGDPVPWIHPDLQMYKGTMIPDWAPVQKGDGRIVYINLQSGRKIEEDPRAAYERYQHALKDGYVSAYLIKVLIVGAAGVGKTHLLHLLFNKEPPKERKSTPLMERPVQTILTALKDSTAFKEVTDQDLYELIGHSVNERVNQTANFPDMSMCSSVNKSVLVAEKNMEKEAGKDSEITPISEVEENLVIPISKYKNVARLHDIDWIYFIDSGGQPQFHQLLPAFLLHTNLNIFVLRLCDKLDNCPNEEYYEEKIGCISSAISVRSNKEILQSCAQATQTKDTTANSRLIIVGTHRDQEHLCANETQQDKSKLLRELLLPSMENYIMMNSSSAAKSDIMFSLNTKNPDSSDIKIAEELRNTILSMKTRIEPQKIPLKWLMFHQELQALSKKLNTDQLDFEQCALVAKRLHLQGDTATALMFFSKLNVIMYYPEVLPDVIFINSQSLLNIVTLLIKYVLYDNNHKLINDHIIRAARSEGIISIELLKLMRSDVPHVYKPTMINEQELLNLLSYLGIVCKSDKGYFMPSLLKGLDVKHIESLLSKHPDSVAPCAVYHENRWLDCGAFGFLITSLLSSKTWKIAFDGPDLPCVHSNLIKMYYDSSIVTFVDYVSHIELHVHAKDVHTCQDICPEILWSVFNAFNEVKPLFTFICPCTNFERHIAKFSSNSLKRKEIFCSREQTNKFELSSLGDEPLVWILKAVSVLKINMDKIIHEIQNPDKLTDLLCSSNIISCDLQDKVHTSSDIKNKNRIMLDAVCAHLSSKPQEYAVFRRYALQMHPSLKRFLPSEYCLSCIPLDDERDAPAPKRPKKEIQEEDLKYPGFCEPYFTENCVSCVSLDEKCDVPAPKRQKKANQEEEQGNNKSPGLGVDTGNSVILQCNDHLKIFQVSKAASKKWKAIGRELGFKQDELDSIPCEAGNTSMEDYYAAMLSRWLKWAPPCHPFPSVQLLSQALCNNGEEKRAFDLCKVFNVYMYRP